MRDKEFRKNGTMKENVVSPKKNNVGNEKNFSYGAEILMECITLLKNSTEKV